MAALQQLRQDQQQYARGMTQWQAQQAHQAWQQQAAQQQQAQGQQQQQQVPEQPANPQAEARVLREISSGQNPSSAGMLHDLDLGEDNDRPRRNGNNAEPRYDRAPVPGISEGRGGGYPSGPSTDDTGDRRQRLDDLCRRAERQGGSAAWNEARLQRSGKAATDARIRLARLGEGRYGARKARQTLTAASAPKTAQPTAWMTDPSTRNINGTAVSQAWNASLNERRLQAPPTLATPAQAQPAGMVQRPADLAQRVSMLISTTGCAENKARELLEQCQYKLEASGYCQETAAGNNSPGPTGSNGSNSLASTPTTPHFSFNDDNAVGVAAKYENIADIAEAMQVDLPGCYPPDEILSNGSIVAPDRSESTLSCRPCQDIASEHQHAASLAEAPLPRLLGRSRPFAICRDVSALNCESANAEEPPHKRCRCAEGHAKQIADLNTGHAKQIADLNTTLSDVEKRHAKQIADRNTVHHKAVDDLNNKLWEVTSEAARFAEENQSLPNSMHRLQSFYEERQAQLQEHQAQLQERNAQLEKALQEQRKLMEEQQKQVAVYAVPWELHHSAPSLVLMPF